MVFTALLLCCLVLLGVAAGMVAYGVPGNDGEGEGASLLKKTVYWRDNHNEENKRPNAADFVPELALTLTKEDGTTVTYKTGDTSDEAKKALASLGYSIWPKPSIEEGVNQWTVTYGSDGVLKTVVYQLDENGEIAKDDEGNPMLDPSVKASWSLAPCAADGYLCIDGATASGEFIDGAEKDAWYYLLENTYTFIMDVRCGSLTSLPGITESLLKEFQLGASYDTNDSGNIWQSIPLKDLQENQGYAQVSFEAKSNTDSNWQEWNPEDGKLYDQIRLVIVAPKYTVDNHAITYRVNEQNPDGRLDFTSAALGEGDYFAISYDNASSTNHGGAVDGAYSGGSVVLTLTGTVNYNAKKIWQDEADSNGRPDVDLQLWRYRVGQPLDSAAPVRDASGHIYTMYVDGEDCADTVEISFRDSEGNEIDFPEYDAEGYRYLYVVREYESSDGRAISGYDQVFGEINGDGDIVEGSDVVLGELDGNVERQSGNTYLYNGGTLNNVLSGSVQTSATKAWKAAAFQAEFKDVSVEVALQSRPKGSGDDAWEFAQDDAGQRVTKTIEGFTAETLSGVTVTASMDRYDGLGRELEYRWVENGVFQGEGSTTDLLQPNGTFVLKQKDPFISQGQTREVQYTSSMEYHTDENGATTTVITNSITGTITYDVDKWWQISDEEAAQIDGIENNPNYTKYNGVWYTKNDHDPDTADFSLYRVGSGQSLDLSKPYLSFALRKDTVSPMEVTAPDGAVITLAADEKRSWHVQMSNLPEFDENGHQYEYVLVEQGAMPAYDIQRNAGNYSTTVYNPTMPGPGLQILVQKTWIDDSDTTHRLPVTIQAYLKKDDSAISGASVTLQDGVWYDWIYISGMTDIREVYLQETQVGDTNVTNTKDAGWSSALGGASSWAGHLSGDVTTQYHRYEVTYAPFETISKAAGTYQTTVTNRRLGNVDITVEKTWNSGDNGEELKALEGALSQTGMRLALKLDFHESIADAVAENRYEITYNDLEQSDSVNIGKDPVAIYNSKRQGNGSFQSSSGKSVIPIALPTDIENDTPVGKVQTYYFSNLPKFDANGTIVRYTVEEGLMDDQGDFISFEDYRSKHGSQNVLVKALSTWSMTIREESYQTAVDIVEPNPDANKDVDWQTMAATNSLVGTKDAKWHKEWKDAYRYEHLFGHLPDGAHRAGAGQHPSGTLSGQLPLGGQGGIRHGLQLDGRDRRAAQVRQLWL